MGGTRMSLQQLTVARGAVACVMIACALVVLVTMAYGVHEHTATHCCDFCHFGFIPWIQPAAAPSVAPLVAREWHAESEPGGRAAEDIRIARRGRAPPAC